MICLAGLKSTMFRTGRVRTVRVESLCCGAHSVRRKETKLVLLAIGNSLSKWLAVSCYALQENDFFGIVQLCHLTLSFNSVGAVVDAAQS